jgi:hypothetical protein
MRGAIPPLPNTPSWRGAQLKHRDNFTFIINTTTTSISAAAAAPVPGDGDFREQTRRKRVNYSDSDRPGSVKKQDPTTKWEKSAEAADVATT